MKCPFCDSRGLKRITTAKAYTIGNGNIDLKALPQETIFICSNCKGKSKPTDLVLKVLYSHIGKMNQAIQLECVDGRTISNESSLPPSEVRDALSALMDRKQIAVLQGEVDKSNIGDVYAKITEAGKNIVKQYKS